MSQLLSKGGRLSPNREQRFQWIGATIRVQFAAWPVRFPVFASGLIAITFIKADTRHRAVR
jgi:hypothetical protein